MKLQQSTSLALIIALVNEVSCDQKTTKLVKKNSKTIKTLKDENKKLKETLETLDNFINVKINKFLTETDSDVDKLTDLLDLEIGSSKLSDNVLLSSIRNWLTRNSDRLDEFLDWSNDIDKDLGKLDQKQDDFIGDLGETNGSILSLKSEIGQAKMEVTDIKNKYFNLQNRVETQNENIDDLKIDMFSLSTKEDVLSTKVGQMSNKDDEFERAIEELKGQYNEVRNNVDNLDNELSSLKSKVNQIENIQTTQLNIFGDIATKNDLANLFSQVTNVKYDTPPSCFPNANYGTHHIDWVYSSKGDVWFAKHYADTPPAISDGMCELLESNARAASILSSDENDAIMQAQPVDGIHFSRYYTSGKYKSADKWAWYGGIKYGEELTWYKNAIEHDQTTNDDYIVFNEDGSWSGVQGSNQYGPYLPAICEVRCETIN